MSVDRSGGVTWSSGAAPRHDRQPGHWWGGGADGNERLTAATGALLIVLLAALGVTIVQLGQLIWLHLFLGLVLVGPVVLKMASTGYRMVRYYTRAAAYRLKGPPPLPMRLGVAPAVVLTTVVVFVTGILLLVLGPAQRDPWLLLHKVSFIAWGAFTALHVLGHLQQLVGPARADWAPSSVAEPGRDGRRLALLGALVAGVVLAIVLLPDFTSWLHYRQSGREH